MNSLKVVYFSVAVAVIVSVAVILYVGSRKKNSESDYTYFSVYQETTEVIEKTNYTIVTDSNNITETEFVYLDLNTANAEEFEKLDGIGEVLAEEIIRYRLNNGGFIHKTDILKVNGIGERTYSQIKEHIYVEDEPDIKEQEYIFVEESTYVSETEIETVSEITDTEVSAEQQPININSATIEEISCLPGIDYETAESIYNLRIQIGGFNNVYEILYADGMNDKIFNNIKNFVYLEWRNIDKTDEIVNNYKINYRIHVDL